MNINIVLLGIFICVLSACTGPVPGARCVVVPNGVNGTYHDVCVVAVEEEGSTDKL